MVHKKLMAEPRSEPGGLVYASEDRKSCSKPDGEKSREEEAKYTMKMEREIILNN